MTRTAVLVPMTVLVLILAGCDSNATAKAGPTTAPTTRGAVTTPAGTAPSGTTGTGTNPHDTRICQQTIHHVLTALPALVSQDAAQQAAKLQQLSNYAYAPVNQYHLAATPDVALAWASFYLNQAADYAEDNDPVNFAKLQQQVTGEYPACSKQISIEGQ